MLFPGAQVRKCVLPSSKLCTPGAGCTLKSEHWGQVFFEQTMVAPLKYDEIENCPQSRHTACNEGLWNRSRPNPLLEYYLDNARHYCIW